MLHKVAPTLTQASGRAAASLRSRPHRCCHAWLYASNDTASDAAFCALTSNSRAAVPGPDGALSPSSPAGCHLPARGWQATLGPVHGAVDTDCRPEAPSQGRRGTSQSATRALLSRLSGKRKASRCVPPGWEGAPGPLLLRACRPPRLRALPRGCRATSAPADCRGRGGRAGRPGWPAGTGGGPWGQAVAHRAEGLPRAGRGKVASLDGLGTVCALQGRLSLGLREAGSRGAGCAGPCALPTGCA